jgi:hypothetical protein
MRSIFGDGKGRATPVRPPEIALLVHCRTVIDFGISRTGPANLLFFCMKYMSEDTADAAIGRRDYISA